MASQKPSSYDSTQTYPYQRQQPTQDTSQPESKNHLASSQHPASPQSLYYQQTSQYAPAPGGSSHQDYGSRYHRDTAPSYPDDRTELTACGGYGQDQRLFSLYAGTPLYSQAYNYQQPQYDAQPYGADNAYSQASCRYTSSSGLSFAPAASSYASSGQSVYAGSLPIHNHYSHSPCPYSTQPYGITEQQDSQYVARPNQLDPDTVAADSTADALPDEQTPIYPMPCLCCRELGVKCDLKEGETTCSRCKALGRVCVIPDIRYSSEPYAPLSTSYHRSSSYSSGYSGPESTRTMISEARTVYLVKGNERPHERPRPRRTSYEVRLA